jgi:hypothetical protein
MSRLLFCVACLSVGAVLIVPSASAQEVDLAGMWSATMGNFEELPLRGDPGVEVGEYVGIPMNEAARQHAQSWMPTIHSLPEWQGRPHPVPTRCALRNRISAWARSSIRRASN